MQDRVKKALWLVAILVALGVVGWLVFFGKSPSVAEIYKAELQAKGEKLTFAELGFPKPPEDGAGLLRLTNAVNRTRRIGTDVSQFTSPVFDAPGREMVIWRGADFRLSLSTNRMAWDEFTATIRNVSNEVTEIRAAAEHPLRWFQFHPDGYFTNFAGTSKYPFVELRTAAQLLYADGIEALHAGEMRRARQDLHALIQLTEFNREDTMLVAAMIRVAIAGLSLQFSWQALIYGDWTETDLLAMQRDWERVDLLAAVETGFTGERATTEMAFAISKREGMNWITKTLTSRTTSSPWERIKDQAVTVMWNADEDELFALQHHQASLEAIRALRRGQPWSVVQTALRSSHDHLDRNIGTAGGLNRFRYLLSAMMIPNTSKAAQRATRNETMRRLTVASISLRRFYIRHQQWPEKLEVLTPDFLAAVPIDPMSGAPLRYRREADGGFVLYSVGEDGKDNGGDPTPADKASKYELWNGSDLVWPKPAN